MAQMRQIREAADSVADNYADYDEEYDYYQRLVADELFGTLVFLRNQIDIERTRRRGELDAHLREAEEHLEDAFEIRAKELQNDEQ